MNNKLFPLEKIFGSRTRVKIISLFTTNTVRPYYVREISRSIGERLNAVRRELDILRKIGMLRSYHQRRRRYYVLNQNFVLLSELASIMKKSGPRLEDSLFKNINQLGDVRFAAASGIFTSAKDSPTDLLLVGRIEEARLESFAKRIEDHIGSEITYTPITENEYRYRHNFNDLFLRQIFSAPYYVIVNNLDRQSQPEALASNNQGT